MKNRVMMFSLLMAIIMIAITAAPVLSSQIIKLNFEQIVTNADLIVTGKVIALETKRDDNPVTGEKSIYTFITLQVSDVLKGDLDQETYTFRMRGGVIDNEEIAEEVQGAPKFKKGQQVALFLESDPKLYIPIVGINQGKFSLIPDPKTGSMKVFNYEGKPVTEALLKGEASASMEAASYEVFKNAVNKLK